METKDTKNVEILFTPDWHPNLSPLMGDFVGEVGYITEVGTVRLIGKQKIELTKYQVESNINGPVKSITAEKSMGIL